MTDADVDGSHIRTLLLTLFNNFPFNELIEKNHIYLAQPPLYKITKGSNNYYIKNDKELENFLIKSSDKNKKLTKRNTKELEQFIEKEKAKINIQRFKGLGEMMPKTLYETTLDPEKRRLLRVTIPEGDRLETEQVITDLMGKDPATRFREITSWMDLVEDLDV